MWLIFRVLCVLAITILLSINVFADQEKTVRISTWYWLNSIEQEKWSQDFETIAKAGFTDIVLCWGLDSAAVVSQKTNTKLALDICQKNNLHAYLFIWHPTHNSLIRQPEFQQVDNKGNLLFTFNLFHRKWRATQWKTYLQEVAGLYQAHPAFSGYVFDDTFFTGPVDSFGGSFDKRGDFVSYSKYDEENFQDWLVKKYQTIEKLNEAWQEKFEDWKLVKAPRNITEQNALVWEDWTQARKSWLHEWAEDTVNFIREIDKSPSHEIYVEDTQEVLGVATSKSLDSYRPITVKDAVGVDFGYITQPFDAVCGYTFFNWDNEESLEKALSATKDALALTREKVGKDKKIIHTFWVSEINFSKALPLKYPTAEQIGTITKLAISLGINHIDYYAFRVGDWRVDEQEWKKLCPGSNEKYPVTKPMKDRFLCDRPEILKNLSKIHQELNSPKKLEK